MKKVRSACKSFTLGTVAESLEIFILQSIGLSTLKINIGFCLFDAVLFDSAIAGYRSKRLRSDRHAHFTCS